MNQIIEFSSNHPYLVGMAVVLTMLLIANELRLASRKGLDLSPAETVALMNNGAKILDVRSVEAYQSGHILNAIHIATDDLQAKAEKALKAHKDKFIVVYDDNGLGGAKASNILREMTFKAANLKGGLVAWKAENFPLEKVNKYNE